MRIEISVESIDGVRVAARAGAARVELCAGLSEGGLTPSVGLIEAAADLAEVHVLVRPRPGDFHYSRDEVDLVVRDIAAARRHGAAGVVVGALAGDGTVADDCARFVDAAEGLETTFHRAIDVSADSRRALDRLADLGFTRVLTSGRRRSALDGAPLIKDLATRTRVTVMACGGVRAGNAALVIAATGVADLHAAPRRPAGTALAGDVSYAGVGVPPGYDRFETDPDEVTALCAVQKS
ncbi:copper homeostasis protein CutC [Asanoa iriomotensis]|uniref:PF03932 family protein CutC n=1 Tax=Asanoa iriomotensis TaxID=234613 RepID=A0ABQ4CBY5_9ACTN|nr:copper homeostasis protein CutC [Asanoa iriomotensis]GIF60287.1 copper homeostasis protein CutC [Asanoa iriomotensis]